MVGTILVLVCLVLGKLTIVVGFHLYCAICDFYCFGAQRHIGSNQVDFTIFFGNFLHFYDDILPHSLIQTV